MDNGKHSLVVNGEHFSESRNSKLMRNIQRTGFTNLFPSKFRIRGIFPRWDYPTTPTTFSNGVLRIIGLRSYKKMLGINARRIITRMANRISCWYFSSINFIGHSVSEDISFSSRFTNNSISPWILIGSPYPARRGLLNFIKKACFNICAFMDIVSVRHITSIPYGKVVSSGK